MILITGGCCQGKLDWAAEQFALRAEEILDGASCSLEAATYADAEQSGHPADAESGSSAVAEFGSPVAAESGTPIRALNHFHFLVRRWMDAGEDAAARTEDLLRVNPGMVILTDEIGSGIIPMDGFEREYREVHGRICCRLAQEADAVIRVVCGIGTWIKGEPKLFTIRVIRHGQTFGNTKRRFLGRTDEPLWEGGIRELERLREKGIWGEAAEGALFSSPMLRCLQTAQILFPGSKPTLLPGMIECDFGIMENKNHEELDGDPQYQAWRTRTVSGRGVPGRIFEPDCLCVWRNAGFDGPARDSRSGACLPWRLNHVDHGRAGRPAPGLFYRDKRKRQWISCPDGL